MASKAVIEAQNQLNEALKQGNQQAKAFAKVLEAQLDGAKRLSKQTKDRVKTLNTMVQTEKGSMHLNDKIAKLESRAKQVKEKALNVEIKRLKVLKAGTSAIQDQSEALLLGLSKSISMIKKLPGGGLLVGALGLGPENIEKLQNNLAKIITGALPLNKIFKGMPKNFGKMIKIGIGVGAAVGVIYGTFKLIKKAVSFTSKMLDDAGQKFGVLGARGGEFSRTMQDASTNVIAIGKGTVDVLTVTDNLSKTFGLTTDAALEVSEKVLDTSVALGVSSEEASNLFGIFMGLGGLSLDQAEKLAESTYQLAQQNKVNPSAVMKDIAGSAETIAKFGAQNLESITKAAVSARQMGINLDAVAGAAEGMLDFQGSITKEIQAEVLLGRDLNLGRARRLALEGDLNGVMKEIVKNVGSESKFNRMNIIQRRMLASAVGLTAQQLDKVVRNQDKSVVQAKSFTDLLGKDGLSALTSLINKIKQMGASLLKSLGRPIEKIFTRIEEFLLDPTLQAKFEKFAEGLEEKIDGLVSAITGLPGSIDQVKKTASEAVDTGKSLVKAGTTFGGIYAGAKAGGLAGSIFGLPGAVVGGVLGGLGGLMFGSMLVDDVRSMGGSHLIVTPSGQLLKTNPRDIVAASTRVNDVVSGGGVVSGGPGSMPLGTDMEETNKILREAIVKLDDVTRAVEDSSRKTVTGILNG